MKTTETQQWYYLLLFTMAGIVFFALFYIMAVVFIPPAKDPRVYYTGVIPFKERWTPGYDSTAKVPPGGIYKDFFALRINDTVPIGDYRVIYRGVESGGRFTLEVANTRLDSKMFYAYTFDRRDAARGIKIGSQQFNVLSVRDAILHLRKKPA